MFWDDVAGRVHSLTAVAGSGKTKWIVDQVKAAVDDGVDPADILAVSYTRKSAAELGRRIGAAVGDGRVKTSTLHSAAWRHVREIFPDARVASDEFLARQLSSRLGCNRGEAAGLVAEASTWVERGGIPGQWWPSPSFRGIPEKCRADQIAEAMGAAFEERLRRQLFSYSDLLVVAYRVADYAPSLIIIDEAQDMSPFQGLLVRRWAELGATAWLVGDCEQSIFGFRGADPGLLACAPNRINLTRNYRSTSTVVEVGSSLRADGLEMLPVSGAKPGMVKIVEHKNIEKLRNFVAMLSWMAADAGVDSQILVRTQAEKRRFTTALTVHEAKGLEWRIAHVAGFSNGRFPNKLALTPAEIAEERRLAYVACTRAKDVLFLHTLADRPSPFMDLLPRWVVES